jgi:ABC-2 type transport system permease protein
MERIFLIARREYLAYVRAWGFWISLALLPVFGLVLGVAAPALLSRAEPAKLITVMANDAGDLAAVDSALAQRRRDEVRNALASYATSMGGEPAQKAALAAFDAKPALSGLEAAAIGIKANCRVTLKDRCDTPLAGFSSPAETLLRTPLGETTPDAVKPYLTGEKLVTGRPLHAAVFIVKASDGARSIDIWSTAVVGSEVRYIMQQAIAGLQREQAFEAAGLTKERVDSIDALAPKIRTLDPRRAAGSDATVKWKDRLPYVAAFVLAFVLWSAVFGVANMLLTSVIEEKSNKILDTLLTSVRYHELLAGKLLGVAGVSATMLSAWGLMLLAAGRLVGSATGSNDAASFLAAVSDPSLLLPFFGLFACGYLMFGAIFLSLGSLCETLQEAQTLMTPVILILIGPLMFLPIGIENPQSPVLAGAVWVPFFAPFLLLARMPSSPPLIEVWGPLALMIITTLLVLWAATAVFRGGASGRLRADSLMKRRKASEPA